jgi:hypothetical protein
MPSAVLEIKGDASGALSAIRAVDRAGARVASSLTAAFRRTGEEMTASSRRASLAMARSYQKAAESARDAANAAAGVARRSQRQQTDSATAGARARGGVYRGEAAEARKSADDAAAARERAERRATATSIRESNRRAHADRQAARESERRWGRGAAAVGGVIASVGGAAHGMVQGVRESRAQRETRMNTFLQQTGSNYIERRGQRTSIEAYIRDHHLDADATIGALGEAQSRFNALGGDTASARQSALASTLEDVDFANAIDPENMGGLVSFGAMLRGKVGEGTRRQLLRSATGISFQGSVETDQALQSALPGLLQSVSSMTAGVAPGQRDAVTRNVITDFLAQIQTVAATGGRVGVTSNRIGTLRTALSNNDTQNRLGTALAHRQMTDAQRAEFNGVFTRGRNGRYTMNQDVVNSPSRAAALFGHLFSNDPTAVRNFLGAHGGGGNRQLLNRPEAGLLTSYFAEGTDAQGRTRRQYDTVNDLARATITPEREADIRAGRAEEDRNALNDNANNYSAALGNNTSALNKFSNALVGWASKNPVLASAATTVAGAAAPSLLSRAGSAIGGFARTASGGLGRVVAGGAGLLSDLLRPSNQNVGGSTDFFDDAAAMRAHRGGASAAEVSRQATVTTTSNRALELQRAVASGIREGFEGVRVTVDPAAQAASSARGAGGASVTPAGARTSAR